MLTYWIERLRPGLTLPLAGLIAIGAGSPAGLLDVLLAWLLIAEFRLWDDLADRDRDRLTHPERTLVRVDGTGRFVAMCAGLGAMNVMATGMLHGGPAVAVLVVLHAGMAAYYRWRPAAPGRTSDLLLLAKYPGFALVLAQPGTEAWPRIAAGAAAVYVAACAFEIWHNGAAAPTAAGRTDS